MSRVHTGTGWACDGCGLSFGDARPPAAEIREPSRLGALSDWWLAESRAAGIHSTRFDGVVHLCEDCIELRDVIDGQLVREALLYMSTSTRAGVDD